MDNKDELLSKLADTLQVSPNELTEDFALNGENWDSFAHLGAIAIIDEVYGVSVPSNELVNCQKIGDLLAVIEKNVSSD